MKPDFDELKRRLQREEDRHYGMISVGIVALVLLLLFTFGAIGAEPPKFTVVNKCPPSFKVTNKMPAAPAVAAKSPFTRTGEVITAQRAAAPNTASVVIYPTARTRTLAPWTGQYGAIANCSYG